MANGGYNHFCPVSKACELLEPRWTLLILCEMWSGSTRFNEIRRGVPGMSPTLMVKRLREMEANGLIVRSQNDATGDIAYRTTEMAKELEPIVHALGKWAHRNVDADVTLEKLDARILMWNMRRKIDASALPSRRRSVTAELKAMTSAWIGLSSLETEIAHDKISLIGDTTLAASMENWMVRSSYAIA
ncbi:winged helix-turn-helix transcriptional regulator [Rhizobium laguerreae]|uniref:winged helix-turn-helix transcriptional regulator n=1 Tax=Rhizobium laguerreae TaxID=1076926 RepID=UPI001C917324|nr:helix-turn-helix domain-containing protein [Rhizobium laguerreae]MBY3389053.1 helix-turn-helix transcriptional regulator [Rhizobium laguerreae]MBY3402803.1 helix-turn-helix transcriptional regulator [Rhizobium laguerreae]MBY3409742.1 helix-turn-helix transcriptional regulator [Rhizobium laguerreae]